MKTQVQRLKLKDGSIKEFKVKLFTSDEVVTETTAPAPTKPVEHTPVKTARP